MKVVSVSSLYKLNWDILVEDHFILSTLYVCHSLLKGWDFLDFLAKLKSTLKNHLLNVAFLPSVVIYVGFIFFYWEQLLRRALHDWKQIIAGWLVMIREFVFWSWRLNKANARAPNGVWGVDLMETECNWLQEGQVRCLESFGLLLIPNLHKFPQKWL